MTGPRARLIEWIEGTTAAVVVVAARPDVAQRLVLTMVGTVPKMFMVLTTAGDPGESRRWMEARG